MTSISDRLKHATVAIAGLGGLGSNVAVALARAGIGNLIIADFDDVEPGNLNRQHYFIDQIGKSKVECTIEHLKRINPDITVTGHKTRIHPGNVLELFARADVIAECFDKADQKQMLVETVLTKTTGPVVVSASGLAGYGRSNAIITRRVSKRLILVGDGESGTDSIPMLSAPRVGIAACHQANAIIELIIDELKT